MRSPPINLPSSDGLKEVRVSRSLSHLSLFLTIIISPDRFTDSPEFCTLNFSEGYPVSLALDLQYILLPLIRNYKFKSVDNMHPKNIAF